MKCKGLKAVRVPNIGEIIPGQEIDLPNTLAAQLICQGIVKEIKTDVLQELSDDRI
jgi:hypothetical protein